MDSLCSNDSYHTLRIVFAENDTDLSRLNVFAYFLKELTLLRDFYGEFVAYHKMF